MSAGNVVAVEETQAGSELVADIGIGVTVLTVEDPTDFQPDGGELLIDDEEIAYSDVNEETGVITLDAPTTDAHLAEARVYVLPATTERWAHVMVEGDDETMQARVPHALYDRLTVGVRDPDTDELELVDVDRDQAGELFVADILERVPLVDGSFIDPGSTIPPGASTDGDPPAISPAASVQGGIRSLFATWSVVANHDPVVYEVHVSTSSGFTPSPATYAGETGGTLFVIRTLPGTVDPPLYGTVYYVRIIARDFDGAAAAGVEGSGTPAEADTADIAVEAITADRIRVNSLTGDRLAAVFVIAGQIATAEEGARVVEDAQGFRVYSQTEAVLVDFPTDETKNPKINGDILARSLTALNGATLQGASVLDKAATLVLKEGLNAPAAPTLAIDPEWKDLTDTVVALSSSTFAGLFYDSAGDAGGATATFLTGVAKWTDAGGTVHEASVREYNASTGALLRTLNLGAAATSVQGVTRVGSSLYVLFSEGVSFTSKLARYAQATLAFTASVTIVGSLSNYPDAVGTDGTDVLVVMNRDWTPSQPQVQKRNATTLALTSTTTCSSVPSLGFNDYTGIIAQGGSWWLSLANPNTGFSGVYALSTAGAYTTNRDFQAGDGFGGGKGVAHDGTRFYTLNGPKTAGAGTTTGPRLNRHSLWDWTTESSQYWVAATWRDDGSSYETVAGAIAGINLGKWRRSRVSVSLQAFPSGVSKFRVYATRNATIPASTALDRQTTTTYLTTETASPAYLIAHDNTGAAPPTTSNFPASSSTIAPEGVLGGGFLLRGDGRGHFASAFEYQEVINDFTSKNAGAAGTTLNTGTVTLPTGWGSMDVLVFVTFALANAANGDHRVNTYTLVGGLLPHGGGEGYTLITSTAFPNEPTQIKHAGIVPNLTANAAVSINVEVTGGNVAAADITSSFRYMNVLKIRRS